MENCCEICAGFLSRARLTDSAAHIVEIPFEERTMRLCSTHAYIAAEFTVTSVSALRHLFRESAGRRSFVARRQASDHSGPQPDSRSGRGRRASDWN